MSLFDRYHKLVEKVDASVAVLQKRHGEHLRCGPGCSDCCEHILTFFPIEVLNAARYVSELPEPERARILEHLETSDYLERDVCPLLNDKRCMIYPARPLLCRSHGLLVTFSEGDDTTPPERSCPYNYTGQTLEMFPRQQGINQSLLSALLYQVNGLFSDCTGWAMGSRRTMADLPEMMELLKTLSREDDEDEDD